ncbi:hypothetical protein PGT21_002506 [Puccinia graminis f. sp. tritici]|uniref:Uncharacterized protein n=2 Tax=Puccinia graminis f. sp. tritici TaxID=56615 RepID=E3KLH4_PUCGT|nr:uncharacterized protein PGTG_11318 [Puccinia graminis f. sp. tritici CRL 75-36-700-3]EFP85149.2 hypothetical protein PGTG_11318 [Puccinia graminis f. sp. tritici CRL 75-36-700-3]KAA1064424.1 hypothetical protein PGT21_002506 [Puccinia graminis f. sp. tritici]
MAPILPSPNRLRRFHICYDISFVPKPVHSLARTSKQKTMKSFVVVACLLATLAAATPVELHSRMMPPMGGGGMTTTSSVSDGQQSNTQASSSPFGSSYSHTESSHHDAQSSTVVQSFGPLMSQIGSINNMLMNGGMNTMVASQSMSTIANQLQSVFSGLNTCGCFQQGSQVFTMFNDMFAQLSQMLISMQNTFGASAMGGIVSPLGNVAGSMSQFFTQQQSSTNWSSMSTNIMPFINCVSPFVQGFSGLSQMFK